MKTLIRLYLACIAAISLVAADPPHVVFLIGEDEYETWNTLPAFAESELKPREWRVTIVQQSPDDKHQFPGLVEALKNADLLVLSVRRRSPPAAQLDAVKAYLRRGGPLVAIRTSSHAFAIRSGSAPGAQWPEFDAEVLGGNYTGHHGSGPTTRIRIGPEIADHPILEGVELDGFEGHGSLYKAGPLKEDAKTLLIGSIPDRPGEPIAWTRQYGDNRARVFYTSLGHPDDFKEPAFRRLLLNAMFWALNRTPPKRSAAAARPDTIQTGAWTLQKSSVESLYVPDDLELDLVLEDPLIANPLYITFDERGRLWLVEYRQYPWPAGLKLLSHDNVWRNVYDPPFPPPPPHAPDSPFRGRDRISIHEDSDGDGKFDKHSVFLDGLNLCTAALPGRGGVFVLNPPYLLYYEDRDRDDRPDIEPRILLSGFGLEDTHSIANSLRWGPDGWIYATHGSTVSAAIVRHGPDGKPIPGEEPIRRMGQFVWRYHPAEHKFEVFAEGGGNAFGVEIDSKGRVFSGHNGGDTRGFHYVQGGYFRKGFDKHGALSNPYAFGYFEAMKHPRVERFTHTFTIYEAPDLPARYHGKLFGVAPHLHYVVHSEIFPDGSSLQTRDISKLIVPGDQPRDDWFTPVDIQLGPDGTLYIADWNSVQVNHYRNHWGLTNPDLGRVYRLRASTRRAKPESFDLAAHPSADLIERFLVHPNRWFQQTALRILGDRKDRSVVPLLRQKLDAARGPSALLYLWALHLSGGFDEPAALALLQHPEPHVRRWTVRLLGDPAEPIYDAAAARMLEMARTELDPELRSQLAATARRLPAPQALPILAAMIETGVDQNDIHIPLMIWWAIEAHAEQHSNVVSMFSNPAVWKSPIRPRNSSLPENLVRRWAMSGTQRDLLACAQLIRLAPSPVEQEQLLGALMKAFEGRPMPPLPEALTEALAGVKGVFSLVLQVKRSLPGAIADAALQIADSEIPAWERALLIRALSDEHAAPKQVVPALLEIVWKSEDIELRKSALAGLRHYDDPEIGGNLTRGFGRLPAELRLSTEALLASRAAWAEHFIDAIAGSAIPPDSVHPDTVEKLRLFTEPEIAILVRQVFGEPGSATSELDAESARIRAAIENGGGDPRRGEALFFGKTACATCHQLFDRGGHIGPDLTPFDRTDLTSMLLAIVNPNAEIREGYETFTVTTRGEQVFSGFKADEDERVLVLRSIDGQNIVILKSDIHERQRSRYSLMPEGLLAGLTEAELRDLFAYLASTTPPK